MSGVSQVDQSAIDSVLGGGREVTDWGRMERATVRHVAQPQTVEQLVDLVAYAAQQQLPIALRGAGHSAGGQSFCQDAVMVDISGLNRILDLDEENRTIRVQCGATWGVLTRALEPLGLAVTTKQEFDLFTIGGSIACNVHGKSVDYGPLIEAIDSFRLLTADGQILEVSRKENAELFPAVIGGYGLLGIVVDVTLRLVKDRIVTKGPVVADACEPLIARYLADVRAEPERPPLCYGFLNVECTRGFYLSYRYVSPEMNLPLDKLKRGELKPGLVNFMSALQRRSRMIRRATMKIMQWESGKRETTLRSRRLLLWDDAPAAFGEMLFQKYFVPADRFVEFCRKVGDVFREHGDALKVLTNHFRFVPANDESLLSFAPQESICMIPCYLAEKDSQVWQDRLRTASQHLIDATLRSGGTYYLTFDALPTGEQLRTAYPGWDELVALKERYDPHAMFNSRFYQKYSAS